MERAKETDNWFSSPTGHAPFTVTEPGTVCRNPPDGLGREGEHARWYKGIQISHFYGSVAGSLMGMADGESFLVCIWYLSLGNQFILIFYLKHQNDTQDRRLSAGFLSLSPEWGQIQSPSLSGCNSLEGRTRWLPMWDVWTKHLQRIFDRSAYTPWKISAGRIENHFDFNGFDTVFF